MLYRPCALSSLPSKAQQTDTSATSSLCCLSLSTSTFASLFASIPPLRRLSARPQSLHSSINASAAIHTTCSPSVELWRKATRSATCPLTVLPSALHVPNATRGLWCALRHNRLHFVDHSDSLVARFGHGQSSTQQSQSAYSLI